MLVLRALQTSVFPRNQRNPQVIDVNFEVLFICSCVYSLLSEILLEEQRERDESMRRENRRVHGISWGSNGEDAPPPKPSRVPATYVGVNVAKQPAPPSVDTLPGPTTYLVAPNSEVLAQLMRENENRADAGMYTAPASAFNTFTVEFTHSSTSSNPTSPQHKIKTKSRKQQQQHPVYANIMMSESSTAAHSPVPVKDVRIARSRHLDLHGSH